MRFDIYGGDGNNGLNFLTTVEVDSIDEAVTVAESFKYHGEEYTEASDDDCEVYLTLDETSKGETAHNGAAFHVLRIVESVTT